MAFLELGRYPARFPKQRNPATIPAPFEIQDESLEECTQRRGIEISNSWNKSRATMTRKTIAENRAELEDLCQQVEDRVPGAPSFEVWSQGPPCDQIQPVFPTEVASVHYA